MSAIAEATSGVAKIESYEAGASPGSKRSCVVANLAGDMAFSGSCLKIDMLISGFRER